MELYFVRHGQSENNVGNTSTHNVPLTALGQKQIHQAANALVDKKFDVLYCSPLDRALQTAAILSSKLNIPTYVHPDFSEVGFCWGEPNATREQLQSAYPFAVMDASISEDGWASAEHETEDEAYERAGRVVDFLFAQHFNSNATILIISHGRFGSILIGYLVGVRPCGYARFSQNNGGISLVKIADGRIQLRCLNATAHLPEELLT